MERYTVNVYDINGELLYKFEDVKPVITKDTITISEGKFVKDRQIELNCIAENAIAGQV
jgi:hypothetical protein